MSQALYRKWRPQTWDEVVGQDHIVLTLRNAVKGERVAHAYLFAGPRGTGKTTTARLLAKSVNCLAESPGDRPCNDCANCKAVTQGRFLDLVEIDAASNTSVEDVRDLRDKINFSPNEGRYKVYIVDEVHMLSTAAFNALLKTLEEPPAHAIFVLATTEVHKIPPTVLSRCQRHEFRRLPLAIILDYLKQQCENEGLQVDPEALELIARQATGSLRDAISMLDQLTSIGEAVRLELAREVLGTATDESVRGVVQAWVEGDQAKGLGLINRALDGGADPRQFARQVVDYLRKLLLAKMGAAQLVDAVGGERGALESQAQRLALPELLAGMRAFSKAGTEGRATWLPGLPLELAFVEAANPRGQQQPKAKKEAQKEAKASSPPALAKRERKSEKASKPRGTSQTKDTSKESSPANQSASNQGPSPMTSSGVEGLTFQGIMDGWKQVLDAAYGRNPRAQALLNSCRPMGLRDGELVVGFPSDLLVEKMEKEHNLAAVQAALQDVFGGGLKLRCVVIGKERLEAVDEASAPVEEGGMVATAVRDLGAQVVEVKPGEEEQASEES
jgi:DNA polymerase-3 subunit gamma/tau